MALSNRTLKLTHGSQGSFLKGFEGSVLNIRAKREAKNTFLGAENINKDIVSFIESLNSDPKSSLGRLRKIIDHVPSSHVSWLTQWTDHKNYDILHHSIMSNRSDILVFLLGYTSIYPESHQPKSNPYAHMAATLGFLQCLETILTYRRNDFFTASEPRHAVNLPPLLMQRLKLNQSPGMVDKQINNLIKCIKRDAELAESKIHIGPYQGKSHEEFLADELKKLREGFSEKYEKRKRTSYTAMKKITPNILHDGSKNVRSSKELKQKKEMTKSPPLKVVENKSVLNRKLTKSKITVYQDVFKDECVGVMNGAGDPIEVIYSKDHLDDENKIPLSKKATERNNKLENPKLPKIKSSSPGSQANFKGSQSKRGKSLMGIMSATEETQMKSHPQKIGKDIYPINPEKKAKIPKKLEIGLRTIKKYKEFVPVIEHRILSFDDPNSYKNKTPLTLAAEKGHIECVKYILNTYYTQNEKVGQVQIEPRDPLTLAVKARSPEALAMMLEKKVALNDYQTAVLEAIRDLLPDCLTILLSLGGNLRGQIFEGSNLFHVLFTQSLMREYRYEMLPEMTRVLILCNEDVNARNTPKNYPLYTLITCAFNVNIEGKFLYYLTCLKMMLDAKADPHLNEIVRYRKHGFGMNSTILSRDLYSSAIHCVFDRANFSLDFFEKSYWSHIIMMRFIETIEARDKTRRQVNGDILFVYMEYVAKLGLNRRVLRTLLRYGANPDCKSENGNYAVNSFFEIMLPFLTKFRVKDNYSSSDDTLDTLLILCRSMSSSHLREAVTIFLDTHLLSTPLQALSLTRKFCYYTNEMIMSPRTLLHITSQFIWQKISRNKKAVYELPIPYQIAKLIFP